MNDARTQISPRPSMKGVPTNTLRSSRAASRDSIAPILPNNIDRRQRGHAAVVDYGASKNSQRRPVPGTKRSSTADPPDAHDVEISTQFTALIITPRRIRSGDADHQPIKPGRGSSRLCHRMNDGIADCRLRVRDCADGQDTLAIATSAVCASVYMAAPMPQRAFHEHYDTVSP